MISMVDSDMLIALKEGSKLLKIHRAAHLQSSINQFTKNRPEFKDWTISVLTYTPYHFGGTKKAFPYLAANNQKGDAVLYSEGLDCLIKYDMMEGRPLKPCLKAIVETLDSKELENFIEYPYLYAGLLAVYNKLDIRDESIFSMFFRQYLKTYWPHTTRR